MSHRFHVSDSKKCCGRAAPIGHASTCRVVRLANAREAGLELVACREEIAHDLDAAYGHALNAFRLLAGLPVLRLRVAELCACLEDGLDGLALNQLDEIELAVA